MSPGMLIFLAVIVLGPPAVALAVARKLGPRAGILWLICMVAGFAVAGAIVGSIIWK